jgi:hypothetical protein
MKRLRLLAASGLALGATALAPASAWAQPTCAQLATDPANGLAGNATILSPTATLVPAAGANAAYCRIDFTVSERGGLEHGYADGEKQAVVLRVGLPLNTAAGGTAGVAGAWNG